MRLTMGLLTLITALSTPVINAEDRYLMIGGGATPESSQVSIESNVVWFDEILTQYGFNGSRTLYASGFNNTADVALHLPEDPAVQHWLPLARLNAKHESALTTYRKNKIAWAESGADKSQVEAAIRQEVERLQENDSLLILYSGHGSHKPKDVSGNALRLWGEIPLTVRDFQRLIFSANGNSKVRYILPQCFSGAFTRAIVPNPSNPTTEGISGNQCGFVAVSDNVIAEGCTPSIDTGDYRDYATYFFAALTGESRTGEQLTRDPDLDSNGEVSLKEAHLYAYTEGFSTDIPRTTSDYYLELWEPWYVRWHTFVSVPTDNNPYFITAQQLANKYGISNSSSSAMSKAALKQRAAIKNMIRSNRKVQREQQQQAERLRKAIRNQFLMSWPNARYTDSAAYVKFLTEEAEAALLWIKGHKDFSQLAELQDRASELSLQILELQRQEAQYARINRALKLATILENFKRLANDNQRKTYDALVGCEGWTPPKLRRSTSNTTIPSADGFNP